MGTPRARIGLIGCLGLLLAGCQPASPPPSPWDSAGDRTWMLPTALGTPLDVDRLEARGPELVVSRGVVRLDRPAVCLYRAKPRGRRFRVFAHHIAAHDGGPVRFELRIRSLATTPQPLRVGPNSLGLPNRIPTASWTGSDHGAVGALAMHTFLEARAAQVDDVLLGALPYSCAVTVEPRAAWSFIAEFEGPAVAVELMASRPGSAMDHEAPLLALPDDPESSRGLFAAADRRVVARAPLDGKPRFVELGGPFAGADGDGLPGEYETFPAANPGNHGVVYEFELDLRNPSPKATRAHLLLSMLGGPGGLSVIAPDDGLVRSWSALQLFETVRLGALDVLAGGSAQARLTWSLAGGALGPHRLYLWPDDPLPPG